MTVVAVARASVMIAAYPMIACRLSSVITSKALPASTMPSHATAMSGAVSTAMSAATAMTTATTATALGIGGTDRRDIGRQECRHPECQCTSKDSNQRFFHFLFGSEGASGWLKCKLDLTQTPKFSHSDRLPGKRRSRLPERVVSKISTAPAHFSADSAAFNNYRRPIKRFDSANNVVSCGVFLAKPRKRVFT